MSQASATVTALSPISWVSGSQLTMWSRPVTAARSPRARQLATTMPWLNGTTLGSPVLPEVSCITAMSSGDT